MSEVVVLDYDPSWPRQFDELRASIWPAVADFAISIEHVGSTAVPGLAAKPVIDVDVVVRKNDVANGIARIIELGYEHRGDLGIPDREAFRRRPGSLPHHLYLCPEASQALANHLAIRDYLRTHKEAASAYGKLKKRLAREFPGDVGAYVEGKTEFLVEILRTVGFGTESLAEVERMNKRP